MHLGLARRPARRTPGCHIARLRRRKARISFLWLQRKTAPADAKRTVLGSLRLAICAWRFKSLAMPVDLPTRLWKQPNPVPPAGRHVRERRRVAAVQSGRAASEVVPKTSG